MSVRASVLVLLALSALGEASRLRNKPATNVSASKKSSPDAAEITYANETMSISPHKFMEVTLGPFSSAAEACDYCYSSYTKKGDDPAGPVAPYCVCMAYPEDGGHNMFCATPASAADYVKEKGGCRCKKNDQEAMGATTCSPM
eukprot:gnl/TRDRNA2_/TRDRNA2_151602_c0_seq4.p2 gnl/TRDRNA2_/TRDRNA2_151602_c0~~gnl/TRDRNA2_/TRDRNA2_151602_c0_seq4.p2  ORF type:complete len:144 (-),score=33.45 gnl/TRDRNA2_/TRDRNA2_151602_c0_seq4:68-499(-)